MTPSELRQLREFFRLTPAQFAGRCGVRKEDVIAWESDPSSPQARTPSPEQADVLEALSREAELCHTPVPPR